VNLREWDNIIRISSSNMDISQNIISKLCVNSTIHTLVEDVLMSSIVDKFFLLWEEIERPLTTTAIEGTKLQQYIDCFVSRTKKSTPHLVQVQFLQNAVSNFFSENASADNACRTYLFAAAAIGSMQLGEFHGGMQRKMYAKLNKMLRPCYHQERVEVVAAHLLIAYFCFFTAQQQEYIKHSGFSRVLLGCLEKRVTFSLQSAQFSVIIINELQLLSQAGLTHKILNLLLTKFSISVELFEKAYPHLNMFFCKTCLADSKETLTKRAGSNVGALPCEEVFAALIQAGGNSAMLVYTIFTRQHFWKAITDYGGSFVKVTEELTEQKEFLNLVMIASKVTFEELSPILQVYIRQIDLFLLLFRRKFEDGRKLLAEMFEFIDMFLICTGLLCCPPTWQHELHFLLIAAAALGMCREHDTFREKITRSLGILHIPFLFSLEKIENIDGCFRAICDRTECQQLCLRLLSVCSKKCV